MLTPASPATLQTWFQWDIRDLIRNPHSYADEVAQRLQQLQARLNWMQQNVASMIHIIVEGPEAAIHHIDTLIHTLRDTCHDFTAASVEFERLEARMRTIADYRAAAARVQSGYL